MLQQVFYDETLNNQINTLGYALVPLLNNEEVELLLQQFNTLSNSEQKNTFTTFANTDVAYRAAIDRLIKDSLGPKLTGLLVQHRPYWGNVFTKPPQSPPMPLHADWQYVHEPNQISLNVWCALTNTTAANGAFGVVPYSHLAVNQIRGVKLPRFYGPNDNDIQQAYGTLLTVTAGTAVIYDHRLLHYSLANQTTEGRPAATLVCVPQGAEVVHYYSETEGDTIKEYIIPGHETFIETPFFTAPKGITPGRTIHTDFTTLTRDMIAGVTPITTKA